MLMEYVASYTQPGLTTPDLAHMVPMLMSALSAADMCLISMGGNDVLKSVAFDQSMAAFKTVIDTLHGTTLPVVMDVLNVSKLSVFKKALEMARPAMRRMYEETHRTTLLKMMRFRHRRDETSVKMRRLMEFLHLLANHLHSRHSMSLPAAYARIVNETSACVELFVSDFNNARHELCGQLLSSFTIMVPCLASPVVVDVREKAVFVRCSAIEEYVSVTPSAMGTIHPVCDTKGYGCLAQILHNVLKEVALRNKMNDAFKFTLLGDSIFYTYSDADPSHQCEQKLETLILNL